MARPAAKLSDIKVDAFVIAQGTQRADGSLDAEAVHSGFGMGFGWGGDGRHGPDDAEQGRTQRGAIGHAGLT